MTPPAVQDLAFRPVANPAPKRLTPADVAAYNREGFVRPFRVLDVAETQAHRAYADRLLRDVGEGNAYAINCYQARLAGIWDICTHPRILDLVEDVVGPNIVCWASHYFCKMPGDPRRVGWHQDASFWKLSPARTATVWLAVDDADPQNAAMQFIPQSHDKGHLAFKATEGTSVLRLETVGAEEMGAPVSDDLLAGEVSLHADMLVHGSPPNLSARRRCGLTIRYCPPEVAITDPAWATSVEAIICRGEDRSGRWRHHPRPQIDDIRGLPGPFSVGGN